MAGAPFRDRAESLPPEAQQIRSLLRNRCLPVA
jgi:hypothetical protein